MGRRETVKNIKPVFCRFDMDKDQERRAWQIIQQLSKGQGEGKRMKYNDIIAKAVVEYYDRAGQMPMKNEELLERITEIIDKRMEKLKKDAAQVSYTYPFPYPYPYPAVMPASAPIPAQIQQEAQPKTEELNEAALTFMDGFMGM